MHRYSALGYFLLSDDIEFVLGIVTQYNEFYTAQCSTLCYGSWDISQVDKVCP